DARAVMERIDAADRILQWERGAIGFLRWLPWFAALVPAAFALDVAMHLGSAARVVLLATFIAAGLGLFVCHALVAWSRRNAAAHTARILESRDSRLGSKLINFLQLQAQVRDSRLSPLTRRMAEQAVAECAGELQSVNLLRLAATDEPRMALRRA